MLVSVRNVQVPTLAAQVGRILLRHPLFVVRLVTARGGVIEDRLVRPESRTTLLTWPVLTLSLGGRCIVRSAARDVEIPGSRAVWVASGAQYAARTHAEGTNILLVQWDPLVLGVGTSTSFDASVLPAAAMSRIRRAVEELIAAAHDVRRASAAVGALFEVLLQLGLMQERVEKAALEVPVPTGAARAGAAVDHLLCRLEECPSFSDLETLLACRAAQTRRLVVDYGVRLDLANTRSWRLQLKAWRLHVAMMLMSAPGASTEGVARLVGFRSAAAMCHTFSREGLPSPGCIATVSARLR